MTDSSVLLVLGPVVILFVLAILITLLKDFLKKEIDVAIDAARQSPNWPEYLSMAKTAVLYAEQMKLNGVVADEAHTLKDEAMKALQGFLMAQGLGVLDIVKLDALVEGAYNELKGEFEQKMPEPQLTAVKGIS